MTPGRATRHERVHALLIPTERLAEGKHIITREMENFPLWDIPARVDIKSGPNWLEVA